MLIVFQRRVRLWLANNAMYLGYYEDHRRFLQHEMSNPHFDAIESEIEMRIRHVAGDLEAAQSSLSEVAEAPVAECDALIKLSRGRRDLQQSLVDQGVLASLVVVLQARATSPTRENR